MMRNLIAILILASFTLSSCTKLGKHIKITGKVERESTGEGIANIPVTIRSGEPYLGIFGGGTIDIDEKRVVTDENGRFSVRIKTHKKFVITAVSSGSDDYYASALIKEYKADEEIIIPVLKWVDVKVHVKSVNPYDGNDKVYVDLWGGMGPHVKRIRVKDYGSEHFFSTQWKGTNINSTVYYKITEDAKSPSVNWKVTKNGIEESDFTPIPNYDINKVNEYTFEF